MLEVKEIEELSKEGFNLFPISKSFLADLETPLSAFLKLKRLGAFMLLESVEGGEKWGRFSIIGLGNYITVKSKGKFGEINRLGRIEVVKHEDPLELLRGVFNSIKTYKTENLPKLWGGFFGYLAYDAVKFFEPRVNVRSDKEDSYLYDMIFTLPEALLIFDNVNHLITAVSFVFTEKGEVENEYRRALSKLEAIERSLKKPQEFPKTEPVKSTSDWKVNVSDEEFKTMVKRAKEYIRNGDIIQVVLSRRFEKPFYADPLSLYRALRHINPSPYMYYLDYSNFQIVGASPEVLVRVEDKTIETRPIAGTRRRGRTPQEDKELEKELLSDEKERAEHIMLVDLARNDVGRVAETGSVKVTDLMVIERYSHVMHIVSNVVGKLMKDRDAFDVLKACFPAGTVSGAPKVRAMEIIDEIEPSERGVYAGAVGYFSFDGNMDTAIAIRTAVVRRNKVYVQAGAGIVADSVPELEAKETLNKARALFRAVELAEGGLE
ncbi:anthranilate synthase, component I [Balnearium lithotrophicum]|uniref:Anthranilate synthase component 1 n=1 Tax=Balnearium lithotrophicum TaxID=223788 RepID=A0A521BZB8_9BACT|nr:anthranilate synthase component I [Balnearium lithotrophicum]SMO52503.1 anthranilate synthase, component I [Balnearium lithotrophicum]